MPLLYRVAGVNALLLFIAVVVTIAVLSPKRVSSLHTDEEAIVLGVALVLVVALNVYLVRRVVRPLAGADGARPPRRSDRPGPADACAPPPPPRPGS